LGASEENSSPNRFAHREFTAISLSLTQKLVRNRTSAPPGSPGMRVFRLTRAPGGDVSKPGGLRCMTSEDRKLKPETIFWLVVLAQGLHMGSAVVVHRLSPFSCMWFLYLHPARGIFLDQGSNPCLLHWQADS